MPGQSQQPLRDDIRKWSLDEWNNALYLHFFAVPPDEPVAPIVTLNVTGDDLSVASGSTFTASEARATFIHDVKRAIGASSLAADASRRRRNWDPDHSAIPPFLSHLLFTCMVANDLSEELRWTGNFRIRLSQVLDTQSQPLLDRLRVLWEDLAAWSVRQNLAGAGCRQLRLPRIPDTGYHSIIGYSIRLAVPSRRDQTMLATLFRQNDLYGREPELNSVLRVVGANIRRFSPDFREVFDDFVAALKDKPSAVLALTAFWTAVRNVALAGLEKPGGDSTVARVRMELEDDDGHFWLALTSSTEIRTDEIRSLELPTPRQSPFRFLLTDRDGSSVVNTLFSAERTGPRSEKAFAAIHAAVGEGLLLFEESGDYVFVLSTAFPSSGQLRVLVSDRLKAAFKRAVESAAIRPEITKSAIPGWSEFRGLIVEELRTVDISKFAPLQSVRSLRLTIPPPEIKLRDGIRFGTSFVALSDALPLVEVSGAEQVSVELDSGEWQALEHTADTADTWRFAPALSAVRLLGSHRIVAFAASVPIAERTVHFIETAFSTEYKAPTEPGRWLVESTKIDTVPFPEDAVCVLPLAVPEATRRISTRPAPDTNSATQSSDPEARSLVSLTTLLCSRFSAQRGISEGELVRIMTGELGVTVAKVWPVLRAWLEAGILDVLTDARWRARIYFARAPQLVVHRRSGFLEAVLTGLVPPYLVERFDNLTSAPGLTAVERRSVSTLVPALPRCRSYSLSLLGEFARELNLSDIVQIRAAEELLTNIRTAAAQYSSTSNDSWSLFRLWDWRKRVFTEYSSETNVSGISVEWCRREDGPDRYKVYKDGLLIWWTRSRTWAILAAFTLADVPVFTRESGASIHSRGDSLYLPLPAARIVSWIGPANPGPVMLADGTSVYRYTFHDESARDSVLSKMWPNASLPRPLVSLLTVTRFEAILRSGVGPLVPLPISLRSAFGKLFQGSSHQQPSFVAASSLAGLYALLAVEKGER
jgi:hypothetical protein